MVNNGSEIYTGEDIYNTGAGGGGVAYIKIGGRNYKYVRIGDKLWLAENLEYSIDSSGTQKYYTDDQYKHQCGLYYDWTKAIFLENNKNDLLPDGWRVPTRTDFASLKNYLGSEGARQIKIQDGTIANNFPNDWGGDNTTNFSALPSANSVNNFEYFGTRAYYWSITEYSTTHAYTMLLKNDDPEIIENWNVKTGCMSIRLCKDL